MADAPKRALSSNGTPSSLHLPRRLQRGISHEEKYGYGVKGRSTTEVDGLPEPRTTSSVNQRRPSRQSSDPIRACKQNYQGPQEDISSAAAEGTGTCADADVPRKRNSLNVEATYRNGNLEINSEPRAHDRNTHGKSPDQSASLGYLPGSRSTLTHPSRLPGNHFEREEQSVRDETLKGACNFQQKSSNNDLQIRMDNDGSATSTGADQQLSSKMTSAQEELMDRIMDLDTIRFFLEYNSPCSAPWSSDSEDSDTASSFFDTANDDEDPNGRGGREGSDSDTGRRYRRLRSSSPSDQLPGPEISCHTSNRHSAGLRSGASSVDRPHKRCSTNTELLELSKGFQKRLCVAASDEGLGSCERTCCTSSMNEASGVREKNGFGQREAGAVLEKFICGHATMLRNEGDRTHTPPTSFGFSSANQFSSLPSSSEDSHPDDQPQNNEPRQPQAQPPLEQDESLDEDEEEPCCIMSEPLLTLDEPMEIIEVSNIPLPEE